MDNNEFLALMGTVKNISENTNYIRERQDRLITEVSDTKLNLSKEIQDLHLMMNAKDDKLEKKLDILVEDQKIKNETFEKNDMKLSRAIEAISRKLPSTDIDWKALSEMVEKWKENKDFEKKIKLSLKEKIVFGVIMLASNAGLLFVIIPIFKLFGIDITALKH